MCRLLAYLGLSISLEKLLYNHEHSLITQSYQPQEMISGTVNVDGFGIGWYDTQRQKEPFTYKNTLPIWNDVNLPSLSRYINSKCILAYIRSATAGQALDFSNCQPFQYQNLSFVHNGKIDNFRQTLYRPIRTQLSDKLYEWVAGTTDSEHIFALILHEWQSSSGKSLEQALQVTLLKLRDWAKKYQTYILANIVISDGNKLIISRFSTTESSPSLYWLAEDDTLTAEENRSSGSLPMNNAFVIASEPLFVGNWTTFPENSIMSVGRNLEIKIQQL
ncbi:MAG: ergothioneine biosynthesis protein EgtC [Cyanobacteria bacterium P01_A01_bin.84]